MDRKNNRNNDLELLKKLKEISSKGNNAEVKQNKDGTWVVYEVKKDKTLIG